MILGVNFIGHDPGFAIVDQGVIRDVVEMERVNGDRFGLKWPLSTYKVFKSKTIARNIKKYINATHGFWESYAKHIDKVAVPGLYTKKAIARKQQYRYISQLIKTVNIRFKSNIPSEFCNVGHHMSHAALACFTSPFQSSVVVSIDGQGNDGYFRIFLHEGNKLSKHANYPLCVGMAYESNTILINDIFGYLAAGKLMGLSSYGKRTDKYYKEAKKFIKTWSRKKARNWRNRFPGVKHDKTQNWMNSFQEAWSDVVIETIGKHVSRDDNLCLTGGCALNGITNYKIHSTMTKNLYIPPNPSDSGLSCGAALYCYYMEGKYPYTPVKHQSPFLGIPISDYDKLDDYTKRSDYVGKVSLSELSKSIRQKKIIGCMSGRSEIGPRALGNRSIVCDCSSADMRDIINSKVKFREWYRPFAPIVRKEDTLKYFEFDGESSYMSYVAPIREAFKSKIPAVCHVDGTGRLQTVTKDSNSFFYDLLTEYDKQFDTGVLLNTSFNIKGKAILSSLAVAFSVLDTTELDGVYIDGHFWRKS